MWPKVENRHALLTGLGGLVALTWLGLWAWERSPYGPLLHHNPLGQAHVVANHGVGGLYFSLAGSVLMIAAMMLPASLPLVAHFHADVRQRPDRARLTALLVAGYLSMWTLFGFVVHASNQLLAGALDRGPWVGANVWVIGTVTVLVAGLYQFTPLKKRCLDRCCSPVGFLRDHWRNEQANEEAFRLGVHHGLFSIGCCWPLMLLMWFVGVGSLAWMLALSAVMTIDNVSWGRRLSKPLGLIMLASAAALVAGHAFTS